MTEPQKLHISWDEFDRESRALADILKKSGEITGIVGVARGGLVATAIIANAMNIRNVKTVAVASYFEGKQTSAELLGSVDKIMDGEGWVFIDDLADTGQTAKLLKKRYPKAKLATPYTKPEAQPHVDFFSQVVSPEEWLVFPWE